MISEAYLYYWQMFCVWTVVLGEIAYSSPSSQGYGYSSGRVWMWEWDYKESLAPKNWCFWTVVLEKTLERPLDCKEIQPVHLKGSQSWVFIGRTDVEAETPVLWPPDAKSWHLKRHWCWERMRAGGEGDDRGWDGWMASLTQWTWLCVNLGVGDGQGGLACCSPWGVAKSQTRLSTWTELNCWDALSNYSVTPSPVGALSERQAPIESSEVSCLSTFLLHYPGFRILKVWLSVNIWHLLSVT